MSRTPQPISIGELAFFCKDEAIKYFSLLLNSYEEDEYVDYDHKKLLKELIQRHPRADEKIGCGIKTFVVRRGINTKAFCVVRLDGSEEDFSYLKCVRNPSKLSQIKRCFRNSISDQVVQYKKDNFFPGFKCQSTGKILRSTYEAHVDHHPQSFNSIVVGFIEENKLDVDKIKLKYRNQNEYVGDTIDDDNLVEKFNEYHADRATYRIISREANLRKRR